MIFRLFGILSHILAISFLVVWELAGAPAQFHAMAIGMSCLCLGSLLMAFLYVRQCPGESSALRNPILILTAILWCYTFGYILPYSFGIVEYDGLVFFGNDDVHLRAVTLSGIGYLSWVTGIFAFYRPPADRILRFTASATAAWVLTLLHIVSLTTYFALNGFTALQEAYSSVLLSGGGGNYAIAYSKLLYEWFYAAAGIIIMADLVSFRSLRPVHIIPLIAITCTSILLFLLGRRTPLILLFIYCLFFSYYYKPRFAFTRHAVRTALASVFVLFFIFFISTVAERFRTTQKSLETLKESIVEVWKDGLEKNYVVSAGTQFGIINRILTIVPSEYPYTFGSNWLHEVIMGIPFGSRMGLLLNLPQTTITVVHDATFGQQVAMYHWGIGSQFFADCIYVGGIVGCIIVPFLFIGVFCQIHARGRKSIMYAFFASFILGAVVSGFRNMLVAEMIRYGLWSFLVVYGLGRAFGVRDVVATSSLSQSMAFCSKRLRN